MTDTQALELLAARVEAATGADRKLDAEIRCAVFAPPSAFVKQSPYNGASCIYVVGFDGKVLLWEPRGLSQEQHLGSFTASLDAAMTLVPPPAKWSITSSGEDESWQAWVWLEGGSGPERRTAATPALALTAAALRARIQIAKGADTRRGNIDAGEG